MALGSASKKATRLSWIIGAAAIAVVVTVLVVANVAATQNTGSNGPVAKTGTSSPHPSSSGTPSSGSTSAPEPSPAPEATGAPDAKKSDGEPAPPAALSPIALTAPAAPVPGMVFSLGRLEAVEGKAQGPGEVGGPSLRFSLNVRNDTTSAFSLASTVVNAYYGANQSPATDLREPGGVPLPDSVAPGQTATGVLIFAVPTSKRDDVQITVDYAVGSPVVVFEGSAPR